jgi:hypothetical protein
MTATSEEARKLLSRHGNCANQDAADWSGPFELPESLRKFYSEVGPQDICIEGYGNPTTIPSLRALWDRQAGYRWNGLTNEPIDEWPPNWIVVADEGADPYIFDIETARILFAQHGTGEWDADEIYPDINTMAACIATLGCVILDSNSFEDDNCNINPACTIDAIDRLTKILGDKNHAKAIVEMAGWG